MKRKKDLPQVFLTLEEIAARWRRAPTTAHRLLKKFGVATYRISHKNHLYLMTDIVRIETEALTRPPLPERANWGKTNSPKGPVIP